MEHSVHLQCDIKIKIKQFLILTFFPVLLGCCCSLEDDDWEMDTYVGMTFEQVLELLDEPNHITIRKIDNNTGWAPIEKPYFMYFKKEELEKGVIVVIAEWRRVKGKEIAVWFKIIDGDLIAFSSEKSKPEKKIWGLIYL